MPVEADDSGMVAFIFGEGDIVVTAYGKPGDGQGGIHFRLTEGGEVGRDVPDPEKVSKVLLALHFPTLASLEVVSGCLDAVRRKLTEEA